MRNNVPMSQLAEENVVEIRKLCVCLFVCLFNLTVYWASLRIHHSYKLSLISGKKVKDTRVDDVTANSYRRKHFPWSVAYLRVLINICSLKQSTWEFALYFLECECTLDNQNSFEKTMGFLRRAYIGS